VSSDCRWEILQRTPDIQVRFGFGQQIDQVLAEWIFAFHVSAL
jgi:hypothetical protein